MNECDGCKRVFEENSPCARNTNEMFLCKECIDNLASYDLLLMQLKSYRSTIIRAIDTLSQENTLCCFVTRTMLSSLLTLDNKGEHNGSKK